MKSSMILSIVVVIALAIAGAGFFALNNSSPLPLDNNMTNDAMQEDKEVLADDSMMAAGKYTNYSKSALAKATANNGKALLFFHASWCPTCKAANKDINSKLSQIPENLTILKTDYDKEIDLIKKYEVAYQHTFVQIDADGNMITKWNGGGLDEILDQIK